MNVSPLDRARRELTIMGQEAANIRYGATKASANVSVYGEGMFGWRLRWARYVARAAVQAERNADKKAAEIRAMQFDEEATRA